jgi:ADP-heptose:LPS heptosyltransferase
MKKRVLYFAVSGLGDNLFSIPALMELEQATALTVVVPAGAQQALFEALLPGARVLGLGEGKVAALRVAAAGFGFDYWMYSIGSSYRRTRLINLLGRAKHRFAFTSLASEKAWQSEIGFDICLTPDLGKLSWQNNYRLLVLMDPDYLKAMKPWSHYAAKARERLTARLKPAAVKPRSLFVHAGCNKYPGGLERYKRWPAERYLETVDALVASGRVSQVDYFLGPADDDLRAAYDRRKQMGGAANVRALTDADHHNDLLWVCRRLLESGSFLGNDSGLAHLAALLAVPTVVVMSGIGQPSFTSPDGPTSVIVENRVPCQGCTVGISYDMALQFQCPNDWACMNPISVDQVTAAVEAHLASPAVERFAAAVPR